MHLNPAEFASYVFGGYNRLAVALGVQRWMVHKWAKRPRSQGGTGFVPCRYQARLLELARVAAEPAGRGQGRGALDAPRSRGPPTR